MAAKKSEMKWEEAGFVIRRVNKGKPFQVDEGTRDGKRRRVRFETLGEARTRCRELKTELINRGTAGQTLSPRDRADAAEARVKLGTVPISDAVAFYLAHHSANGETMTIKALVDEYISAPGRRGGKSIERRPETKLYIKKRLSDFKNVFGAQSVSSVTQSAIEKWIKDNGWQGVNGKHYLATVKALFEYARRKKYAGINPAVEIEWADNPEKAPPKILTPRQVQTLLNVASSKAPDLVPALALMFFAGLRPNEAARIDFRAVNVSSGIITIDAATAKMRRQRHITMSDNLKAWLMPYVATGGPIWRKGSTTYWLRVWGLEKASGVKMPYGAGRHAFASYHLALNESQEKTAKELGHADAELLLSVYRSINMINGKPITKEAAQAYFDIRPKNEGQIIPMPFEAAG